MQINENSTVNIYSYLRNNSLTDGNITQKAVMNPDEYILVYNNTKIETSMYQASM